MCRLAMYMGQPIIMSKFVTEPNHSIIKQSNQATEAKLQLNGDGFGIAWYVHDASPHPAVFNETSPAWSNANLRELSRVTRSSCILTHVRQASEGSPVVQTNCHPFTFKKFSFMHNGYVKHFPWFKRDIVKLLSDEVYQNVNGTTDSEHLFALFLEFYKQMKNSGNGGKDQNEVKVKNNGKLKNSGGKDAKLELMCKVICKVISTVQGLGEELKKKDPEKYKNEDFTDSLNLVVCDGDRVVATRYTSGPPSSAHTMFYCTGHHFHCHPSGDTEVQKNSTVKVEEHDQIEQHEKMVIISSEPLADNADFQEIPPNCIQFERYISRKKKSTKIDMIFADRNTIGIKEVAKICTV